jgi:TPR repeat protein
MRKVHQHFKDGVRLLDAGQAVQALALAEDLIKSEDEMDRLDGYTCRGFMFEDGGPGIAVDLDKALDSYRRASLLVPNAISFMHMARVCLKMRDFSQSMKFLDISAGYEITPDILLGFAQWYEECDPPDLQMAKSYYIQAAIRGRFAGFFGRSRVARAAGQPFRAMAMVVVRILCGPVIALAIGTRARSQF